MFFSYEDTMSEKAERAGRSRNVTELLLFHGTDSLDTVRGIAINNFDHRLSGKNATMYGEGVYFAKNAKYSHAYTKPPDRFMFLARVLVGEFTKGERSYKRPPAKPGAAHELYDSCVDKVTCPSIYVVFDTKQYYPEFLIQYHDIPVKQTIQVNPIVNPQPTKQTIQANPIINPKSTKQAIQANQIINPQPTKQTIQANQIINPQPTKQTIQANQIINPQPTKQTIQANPIINPQPTKQTIQANQIINPQPTKQTIQANQIINPQPTKQTIQAHPIINPQPTFSKPSTIQHAHLSLTDWDTGWDTRCFVNGIHADDAKLKHPLSTDSVTNYPSRVRPRSPSPLRPSSLYTRNKGTTSSHLTAAKSTGCRCCHPQSPLPSVYPRTNISFPSTYPSSARARTPSPLREATMTAAASYRATSQRENDNKKSCVVQ